MKNAILDKIEKEQIKKEPIPEFGIGDTVRVHVRIREGDKERIQVYAGVVIARDGSGPTETFTVRRISYGEGVERVFPLHAPTIAAIEVERKGKTRRAKLYYLRDLSGRKARIREKRTE
jgi:large subunit ribosomal protein L19